MQNNPEEATYIKAQIIAKPPTKPTILRKVHPERNIRLEIAFSQKYSLPFRLLRNPKQLLFFHGTMRRWQFRKPQKRNFPNGPNECDHNFQAPYRRSFPTIRQIDFPSRFKASKYIIAQRNCKNWRFWVL